MGAMMTRGGETALEEVLLAWQVNVNAGAADS